MNSSLFLLFSLFSLQSVAAKREVIFPHTFNSNSPKSGRHIQGLRASSTSHYYKYDSYLTFKEMERRIEYLKTSYPDQVRVTVPGKSVEGRNIYLISVTGSDSPSTTYNHARRNSDRGSDRRSDRRDSDLNRSIEDESDSPLRVTNADYVTRRTRVTTETKKSTRDLKPIIFVDAGIHAREWVTPAAAFYTIDQLLDTPNLTRNLEWRIMPMVNPDGYVYSQEQNRFWRKNRANTRKSNCPGVDLNRNFDVHWEETNQNPCSETYSGTGVFSEPESRAVRDSVQEVRSRIQAYITLHTYGQLILYPYGYTKEKSPDLQKLKEMGDGMAKAIFEKYRNKYLVSQASILGAAAGGSDDWAYIKMKIPYSYTLELQDRVNIPFDYNAGGFDLDPKKLPQAVDECWLALQYLGEQIMSQQGLGITRFNEEKTPEPSTGVGITRLYPVGWKQLIQQIKRVQAEVRSASEDNITEGCIKVGNLYVCPHMVFWGSMFNNFRRS